MRDHVGPGRRIAGHRPILPSRRERHGKRGGQSQVLLTRRPVCPYRLAMARLRASESVFGGSCDRLCYPGAHRMMGREDWECER